MNSTSATAIQRIAFLSAKPPRLRPTGAVLTAPKNLKTTKRRKRRRLSPGHVPLFSNCSNLGLLGGPEPSGSLSSTACNKRLDCVALSAFGHSPCGVLPDSPFIQNPRVRVNSERYRLPPGTISSALDLIHLTGRPASAQVWPEEKRRKTPLSRRGASACQTLLPAAEPCRIYLESLATANLGSHSPCPSKPPKRSGTTAL